VVWAKILIGVVLLTTVMSLLVVVGWAGAGITGNVTAINTGIFDGLSLFVAWLVILTLLVFIVNLVLFKRNR